MRSPSLSTSELRSPPRADGAAAPTNQQQEEERHDPPAGHPQFALDKAEESDEDVHHQRSPARPAAAVRATSSTAATPNRAAAESHTKRAWQTGSRQQLLERTRNRIRRASLQQQLDSGGGGGDAAWTTSAVLPTRQPNAGDFAEEIESEAAEIRTLIARTAQLWSAVDRAERAEDLPPAPQRQPLRSFSASALHTSLPAQYVCVEEDDSTLSSDDEEYEGQDEDEEDTETESVADLAFQSVTQTGDYATAEEAFVESLRFHSAAGMASSDQRRVEEHDSNSDSDHDSEDSAEEREGVEHEGGGLQLEQGEVIDASNRAINASKARAIKNAMQGNLLRLGFRENITRAALEAGVLEIDHYDSDCELAYVDIFMSLVKMVCDAHVDVMNESEDLGQNWAANGGTADDHEQAIDADATYNLELRSFLPFKWPVFDMAQFEFGNARSGTCFNSVCVLTNLPKVSMDRTEELMEVLSCNLFCMIGDPIQVVIPSASSTGRTKGHAFLEFDDPDMAKRCALAVDGLTWGRGPFGRIRGNLFRQYQVKSPAEEKRRTHDSVSDDGASFSRSFPGTLASDSFPDDALPPASAFERSGNSIIERFRPGIERSDVAQQQNLLCDSDEDSSDADEWVVGRPLEYAQFNPSPLQDLSPGSVDIRERYEQVHSDGISMQLGWDDEALDSGYSMQMSSEGGGDDENDESFDSNSVLELQAPDEEKLMDQSLLAELVRECRYSGDSGCSPARVSLSSGEAHAVSSTVTSTASGVARETLADCSMAEQSWDAHEGNNGVEKPWRRYCEDLIVRNREMQEQMAFARRRIVQLSHNNQKLHLLIDRVERDRDGLLFENDLLQTQLHGYEDHEEHHDSLMKELVTLRKRLQQKEHSFDLRTLGPHQHVQEAYAVANRSQSFSSSFRGIQSALSHLSPTTLTSCKMDELKEWEHLLETTLSHVRSAKEEKALEMQKKLDRQVEEQNELKLCVICLSNEKTILCLPCRHLCLCKTCSRREEVAKCPICRLEIEEMLAVYS
ncbi:hypothetical protein PHYPSEUDO_010071 [Phytophthora pseudosyringae]|uniref:RING-type domain-containing protein n=1 Tax=Phytophthora pseudosyringae TaxID=221518 RepID=A0A8T1VG65_9STRA|nr:hypothetical protein PHYPSEUDO_010071 [Phytophthora pseudosyringae]